MMARCYLDTTCVTEFKEMVRVTKRAYVRLVSEFKEMRPMQLVRKKQYLSYCVFACLRNEVQWVTLSNETKRVPYMMATP